jgi:hypothetical protein
MSPSPCGRCGAERDASDNFCRRCGQQFQATLPAVVPDRTLVKREFLPAPLVGSMAVLALGTGVEWLARRMAGNAARSAGRALISRSEGGKKAAASRESLVVDETIYVRKVHLHR